MITATLKVIAETTKVVLAAEEVITTTLKVIVDTTKVILVTTKVSWPLLKGPKLRQKLSQPLHK